MSVPLLVSILQLPLLALSPLLVSVPVVALCTMLVPPPAVRHALVDLNGGTYASCRNIAIPEATAGPDPDPKPNPNVQRPTLRHA